MTKGNEQRRLADASAAYADRDAKSSAEAHKFSLDNVHEEPEESAAGEFLKSIVFGGVDGILTAFAIVTAAEGAGKWIHPGVVLVMGCANLLADGIAMGIGEWLSTKAESQVAMEERQTTLDLINHRPQKGLEDLTEVFRSRGFSDEHARRAAVIMIKYPESACDIMVAEAGTVPAPIDLWAPVKKGMIMTSSFVAFGFIPILAYIPHFRPQSAFNLSCVLTGVTMGLLGLVKGILTHQKLARSGLELLSTGVMVALASYLISSYISTFVAGRPRGG